MAALWWVCSAGVLAACGGSEFTGGTGSTTNGAGGSASDGGASGDGGNGSGTGGTSGGGHAGTGGNGTGGHGVGSGGTASGGSVGAGGLGSGGATGSGGTGGTVGAGGAGGGITTQWAKDYPQKCDTDYGCTLVTQGEVCGCPGCPNAAIASSAQTQWDADRSKIDCGPPPPQPTPCPAIDCVQMLASCGDGLCYARQPTYIFGDKYDASCLLDTDCKVIFTGEVCNPCQCGTAAVNASGYQQYQHDISGVKCTPGPSACDCAPQTAVKCKLSGTLGSVGVCTIG